jgi:hypothetical protein
MALTLKLQDLPNLIEEAIRLQKDAMSKSEVADKASDQYESSGSSDRRTKLYKDYRATNDAANAAWRDYNNALRNIGLTVMTEAFRLTQAPSAHAGAG